MLVQFFTQSSIMVFQVKGFFSRNMKTIKATLVKYDMVCRGCPSASLELDRKTNPAQKDPLI